ncbi:MAG: ABC transporter permease [Clostridium sp.]|uniref:ABC transporter permease n=1 Tax=Clostridium sp. TaxID=1506 RepID=UPI00303326FD
MKTFKALAYKNLKYDKKNSVFIFITMTLIISLMVGTLILVKANESDEMKKIEKYEGCYDLRLLDVNNEQLEKLESSENIDKYYLSKVLGTDVFSLGNNAPRPFVLDKLAVNEVLAIDLDVFTDVFGFDIKAGRLPQNDKEVIVTTDMIKEYAMMGNDFEIGSNISLNLETNRTYDMYLDTDVTSIYEQLPEDEWDGSQLNDKYGELITENREFTVVGIVDVGPNNKGWHNKFFTKLTPELEALDNPNGYQIIVDLKDGVSYEEIANEIGVYYVKHIRQYGASGNEAYGTGTSRFRYPNFWKEDYNGSLLGSYSYMEIIIVSALSLIILFNAFLASMAFKTKSLGILSAIGATKWQIRYLVIKETIILTSLSIPFGIILGIIQVKGLSMIMSRIFGENLSNLDLRLSLTNLILVIVLVTFISIIAILIALGRFYRYSPIQSMNSSGGVKGAVYKNKYGEVIDEDKIMKSYIEYDEKTVKYKLMKNLFKLEGSIAYKNLSRNFVMNKNCVGAILMTMVLGTVFLLQYIDMNIEIKYTNPSENWNVTTTSGIGEYTDEAINEIGEISGVDKVYRELVASNKLIVENESVNPIVKDVLRFKFGVQIGENYSHLNAKVRGIEDSYMDIYSDYLIAGTLEGGLKDDEIILVSDWGITSEIVTTQLIQIVENVLLNEVGDTISMINNPEYISDREYDVWKEEYIPSIDRYSESGGTTTDYKIKAIVSKDALREKDRFDTPESYNENLEVIISKNAFEKAYGDLNNDRLNILVNDSNREETISKLKDKFYVTGDKLTDMNEVKAIMDTENNIIVGRNVVYCIGVIVLVLVSLMSMIMFNIYNRSKELAGLSAIGMTYKQKRKMIICESFSMSLQSAFLVIPISVALFVLRFSNDIGSGTISEVKIIMCMIIFIVMIVLVTTLIGLIPVSKMKKEVISDLLRE